MWIFGPNGPKNLKEIHLCCKIQQNENHALQELRNTSPTLSAMWFNKTKPLYVFNSFTLLRIILIV